MTVAVAGRDLTAWLNWQLQQHSTAIELGLDRVRAVAARLGVLKPAPTTVLVAGTNGKGSAAAWVRALWPGDQSVGVFTSPHLWHYNERFTIDGMAASNDSICRAFETIETARGDISLTYFEYSTLCALWLFKQAGVDLAVLEVGLGGRLDATNIVDANAALITSIGLDHKAWLGDDREQIGYEKAGVMRAERPAIVAERDSPASIIDYARELGAGVSMIGHDFDITPDDGFWRLRLPCGTYQMAPAPGVVPENFAGAAALVTALGQTPDAERLDKLLARPPRLPGRRQTVDGAPRVVYDVAHNVEAVTILVDQLAASPVSGRTHIVLGMLEDKPVEAVHEQLCRVGDIVYPAGLADYSPRGLSGKVLAARLGMEDWHWPAPADALSAARNSASTSDRIVVCGSFHTVSSVLPETPYE